MNAYRVVLIGNAAVGKTAIIMRFINKTIQLLYEETVGAAFHTFQTKIDGEQVTIQVWDTAGQEKYRSLGPVYYRNALAAILVFDVTDKQSFLDLDGWIDNFRATAGHSPPIFLVGNKIDLESNIKVDENEAQKYANEKEFPLFLTSAVSGFNIDFLFQNVADKIVHNSSKVIKQRIKPPNNIEESNICC